MRREIEGKNTLRKFEETIRRPSTLCSALQKNEEILYRDGNVLVREA